MDFNGNSNAGSSSRSKKRGCIGL
ncbi:BnaC05g21610D [Brassica napus]|uniref:BnaC05g21610D protein n=1 Tax=Brassica napus TaxID=3708 RepID=A0A078I5Z6_BRANA|nr:BnaC05g21610D [Brassica napus]